ncbi:hypothetical protein [Streptomyces sp. MNP-20]|uniref:hypothetical protein n=1 Tax=Streptomyces sp. MNP-20 TaxID=2721165 RepID=UPI00155778DB|nr:hypothetical protein [Streptomyces sp. MNP-20]
MPLRADEDPCALIKGPALKYCRRGQKKRDGGGGGEGVTDGASDHVKDLAKSLIDALGNLLGPKRSWAPKKADAPVYREFLWLGQHLAVTIVICVVVVCALTAWQGAPRLRQMGLSVGWSLAAVAAMGAVPGVVVMLNTAVSESIRTAFQADESTLLSQIEKDVEPGGNLLGPLGSLLIISALVVALAIAALVFLTRQLGIVAFVFAAPIVLASLARGGDTQAVKVWMQRLFGLLFAPFALLLVTPLTEFAKGNLVKDALILVLADFIMLRMIFHGVPYIGPAAARAARGLVERNITNERAKRLVLPVMRAGVPDFYEQESSPLGPRTVDTPQRALTKDRNVLFAAYGIKRSQPPGRLTPASASAREQRNAAHTAQPTQAHAAAGAPSPVGQAPSPGSPSPAPAPAAQPAQGGQGGPPAPPSP